MHGFLDVNLRVAHIIGGLRIGGAERNLVNVLNSMQCEYRGAVFVGEEAKGPSFHHDLDRSPGLAGEQRSRCVCVTRVLAAKAPAHLCGHDQDLGLGQA